MNTSEGREILLIGGTGFVGQQLAKEALARKLPLIALCEQDRSFILRSIGVPTIAAAECQGRRFRRIINLAYPTRGPDYTHARQNHHLAKMIWELADNECALVHASTVAVFGADMEYPQQLALVKTRRDHAYVESKIQMEWLLAHQRPPDASVDIVRLGNVWGPGSPLWTAGLIQRMLEDAPVGVRHIESISNATDVANAVDYLLWLIHKTPSNGLRFHHLAELGSVSWQRLLEPIAAELRVIPRLIDDRPSLPTSIFGELRATLRMIPLGGIARYITFSRWAGSYARSVLRNLPQRLQQKVDSAAREKHGREQSSGISVLDAGLLRLLSCQRRFETIVDREWSPPVSLQQSVARVLSWMRDVGYIASP